MANLLVNFQKKTADIGTTRCFCSIGKGVPAMLKNSNALRSIQQFESEEESLTILIVQRMIADGYGVFGVTMVKIQMQIDVGFYRRTSPFGCTTEVASPTERGGYAVATAWFSCIPLREG